MAWIYKVNCHVKSCPALDNISNKSQTSVSEYGHFSWWIERNWSTDLRQWIWNEHRIDYTDKIQRGSRMYIVHTPSSSESLNWNIRGNTWIASIQRIGMVEISIDNTRISHRIYSTWELTDTHEWMNWPQQAAPFSQLCLDFETVAVDNNRDDDVVVVYTEILLPILFDVFLTKKLQLQSASLLPAVSASIMNSRTHLSNLVEIASALNGVPSRLNNWSATSYTDKRE